MGIDGCVRLTSAVALIRPCPRAHRGCSDGANCIRPRQTWVTTRCSPSHGRRLVAFRKYARSGPSRPSRQCRPATRRYDHNARSSGCRSCRNCHALMEYGCLRLLLVSNATAGSVRQRFGDVLALYDLRALDSRSMVSAATDLLALPSAHRVVKTGTDVGASVRRSHHELQDGVSNVDAPATFR